MPKFTDTDQERSRGVLQGAHLSELTTSGVSLREGASSRSCASASDSEFNNKVIRKYITPLLSEFGNDGDLLDSVNEVLRLVNDSSAGDLWKERIPNKKPDGSRFSVTTEYGVTVDGLPSGPDSGRTALSKVKMCCKLAIPRANPLLKEKLKALNNLVISRYSGVAIRV